jgi:exportin-1
VDEREIFKICCEYWSKLVAELYEVQSLPIGESGLLMGLSLGVSAVSGLGPFTLRKNIYSDVLSNLRLVVIEKMVKPGRCTGVEKEHLSIPTRHSGESSFSINNLSNC